MNQQYIYLLFYTIVLIIGVAATYFVHMPVEVIEGMFLFIIGHGSVAIPNAAPTMIVRPQ